MHESIYYSDNNHNVSSKTAVIVLPEIYGLKDDTKEIADEISKRFGVYAFAFDFFYAITGTKNDFDYHTEVDKGIQLMQDLDARDFDALFPQVLEDIKKHFPSVENFIVLGFCFGGSLALYSGIFEEVEHIISFYPGQALKPNFDGTMTISDIVASTRVKPLIIDLLFGDSDQLISEEARNIILTKLQTNTHLEVRHKVFHAGHAFMNSHRQTYNEAAANQAWLYMDTVFNIF